MLFSSLNGLLRCLLYNAVFNPVVLEGVLEANQVGYFDGQEVEVVCGGMQGVGEVGDYLGYFGGESVVLH